ncbi:MAG: amino acid ABC transporter substrate-binding protein [Caldilineaceae bacterium]|nr:amino acid ABC transporter substrate-binding protein [Caldilineaceae bacterium]
MNKSKRFRLSTIVLQVVLVAISACFAPVATDLMTPTPAPTEAVAAPVEAPAEAPAAQPAGQSLLEIVKSRGELICGANNQLPGFGYIDTDGNYSGFDVDFCKAIAAAVLGDPDAVQYRPLTAAERFTAVQTGEVDVLFRNTTWTLQRDASGVGMEFMPITFYDGQGMMVRSDSGITSLEDMDGATICVQTGTTTELNLTDNFRARGLDFTPVVLEDADRTFAAYDEGRCDGVTTDKSGLVSRRTTLASPDDHVILDVTMSKEPLAGAVLQGDPAWADAVRWVIYGLMEAEEYGVTSANLDEMASSEDPTIQRLLGVSGDMGALLGLDNDFLVRALAAVGNYGEIYDRNLGPGTPFDLPRGQNNQYTNGGLIYAPPFR